MDHVTVCRNTGLFLSVFIRVHPWRILDWPANPIVFFYGRLLHRLHHHRLLHLHDHQGDEQAREKARARARRAAGADERRKAAHGNPRRTREARIMQDSITKVGRQLVARPFDF